MKSFWMIFASVGLIAAPALADDPLNLNNSDPSSIDLDPQIIQSSPVFQRWIKQVPNVAEEIKHDPSFRTRYRVGYLRSKSKDATTLNLGIEDLRIAQTPLTIAANYQPTFNRSSNNRSSNRSSWGANLQAYARPLGSVVNVAAIVGYRHIDRDRTQTRGAEVGVRVLLALSRGGGADIAWNQTWVAPGREAEVGRSSFTFGYALTQRLRLAAEIQHERSVQGRNRQLGLALEWMP